MLDWLSVELIESGWSVKHLHRQILLSSAYQQTSVVAERLVQFDPENRLLARWRLRRLEAEALRDVVLSVTGSITNEMFGQPVPVMEDEVGQIVLGKENLDGERKPTKPIPLGGDAYRRSVSIQVRRPRQYGALEAFDLPSVSPNCTDRSTSNVGPQSLMLMNSQFMIEQATAMAKRLQAEFPDDLKSQVRRGWTLAYGRPPAAAALDGAVQYVEESTKLQAENAKAADASTRALASYCQALLGSNRFLHIE